MGPGKLTGYVEQYVALHLYCRLDHCINHSQTKMLALHVLYWPKIWALVPQVWPAEDATRLGLHRYQPHNGRHYVCPPHSAAWPA